jgi:uncharacterized protein YdaL
MKCNGLLIRNFVLVFAMLAMGSCMAEDPASSKKNQRPSIVVDPSAAASSAASASAPAAQPIPVTIVGNPGQGTINPFPADLGQSPLIDPTHRLVPQVRGSDKRPAELATISEFAVVPNGALILYDTTGAYGWLGELYGIAAVTLANHFGTTASKPVANYVAGDMAKYQAVIYIGSTYDEPLPVAFLDDVLSGSVPVIWIYDNIWQLANRSTTFTTTYGYNPWAFDVSAISTVTYKGTDLTRYGANAAGIMQFSPFDATKVTTLATATRADGTTLPWAVRSANLTYIGEIPFSYIDHNDRYLAMCDLLFDALAPTAATQHRALVRLEDVSPNDDATEFRAMVDYFYKNAIPFSVATIPLYKDPLGYYNGGKAETIKWTDRKPMLTQMKYATSHGGTLILHGYTHQFGAQYNPYSGVTADDFEFFTAHVDATTNNVVYDGAVPGDSASWALGRVNSGLKELKNAGLATPVIFEYPHYAGSSVDSKAIKAVIPTANHRGLFFGGDLGLTAANPSHSIGMFFPYTVTDVYGWKIKPENLGNYEPEAYNNHPPRLSADLILTAQKNLVIRDGVASFFFHPGYPLTELQTIVTGVQAAGYKFVSISTL